MMQQTYLNSLIGSLLIIALAISCQSPKKSEEVGGNEETNLSSETAPEFSDETDYLVTISTRHGDMKAVLYDKAPQHKANFVKLANEGFYDELLFHRVINQFMIQGGDPLSKDAAPGARLGQGDPGYLIPAEFHPDLYHERGALAAARQGDAVNPEKRSNGSQFYIVQGRKFSTQEIEQMKTNLNQLFAYFQQLVQLPDYQHLVNQYNEVQANGNPQAAQEFIVQQKDVIEQHFGVELDKNFSPKQIETYTTIGGYPPLDGDYTVFGKVVEGLDVLDKITSEATDSANRPTEDVAMTVTVEELSKKEIYEKYGYAFGR